MRILITVLSTLFVLVGCKPIEDADVRHMQKIIDTNSLRAACLDTNNIVLQYTDSGDKPTKLTIPAQGCDFDNPENGAKYLAAIYQTMINQGGNLVGVGFQGYMGYKGQRKASDTAIEIAEINKEVQLAEVEADSEKEQLYIEALISALTAPEGEATDAE